MSAVFSSKTALPFLAFLSTSLLLFLAYSGAEHSYKGRYRYPDIPPPGASDSDRLRYSESLISLRFKTSSACAQLSRGETFIRIHSLQNQTRSRTHPPIMAD